VFFWACLLGVGTQFFINMEITRWALATGESAITGFCRLSRHWAWVFLLLNIVPWMIPAWATGTAELGEWLLADGEGGVPQTRYTVPLAIGGLLLCGAILTAGPVVYETVERVQVLLVTLIVVAVAVLAACVVRADAVVALASGLAHPGVPHAAPGLDAATLLGALAFAGVGGTLNLGQSNYVKEKGYGMGRYIGRITSPITGRQEPVVEIGYHFPATADNLRRWRAWWRAASAEHFFTFFLTCLVCLVALALVSYSLFYDAAGVRAADAGLYEKDMAFLWGEATAIGQRLGGAARTIFLLLGMAILFTTEFGVLDATSRISMDIVKVNWLRGSAFWNESRLYYVFLWGTILLGGVILLAGMHRVSAFQFFKIASALNGAVMFLYSIVLLWLNARCLPPPVRIGWGRRLALVWAIGFFGFFAAFTGWSLVREWTG
jgi:hypothetical protein